MSTTAVCVRCEIYLLFSSYCCCRSLEFLSSRFPVGSGLCRSLKFTGKKLFKVRGHSPRQTRGMSSSGPGSVIRRVRAEVLVRLRRSLGLENGARSYWRETCFFFKYPNTWFPPCELPGRSTDVSVCVLLWRLWSELNAWTILTPFPVFSPQIARTNPSSARE